MQAKPGVQNNTGLRFAFRDIVTLASQQSIPSLAGLSFSFRYILALFLLSSNPSLHLFSASLHPCVIVLNGASFPDSFTFCWSETDTEKGA